MSSYDEQNFSHSLPGVTRIPQNIYPGCTGEQSSSRGSLRRGSPRLAEYRNSAYCCQCVTCWVKYTWKQAMRPALRLFAILFAAVFIIGGLVFMTNSTLFSTSTSSSSSHPTTGGLLPPAAHMSPYEKLGLHRQEQYISNAEITDAEIRMAYRKAVRHFHPDKVKARTSKQLLAADEHVRMLNEAYEELMDPYRRCLLSQVWGCWRHLERQLEEEMRQQEEEMQEEMREENGLTHAAGDQTEDEADDPLGLVVVKLAQVVAYTAVRGVLSLLGDLCGLAGGLGTFVLRGVAYLAGRLKSHDRVI